MVKTCENCLIEFPIKPSILKRKGRGRFCGKACYDAWQKRGRTTIKCQSCGQDTFQRKFCSFACSVQGRGKPSNKHLKTRYGITLGEKEQMLVRQNGKCAICSCSISGKACTDHEHKTGRVRGILCHNCNVGLGNMRDNIGIIFSALMYLKKHQIG